MPTYSKQLAEQLMVEHVGIPDIKISQQIIDALLVVIRKKIIKDGICYLENLGHFRVKQYKGKKKYIPKTGQYTMTTDRNVLLFEPTKQILNMLNMSRPKNTIINQ